MEFKIKAVHEAELEKYLKSLDIFNEIKEGKYQCRHCKTTITLENFLCMYPFNDEIVMCCDNPKCYQKALKEAKEALQPD